jgi:two-component system sensor histidine kinase/response regulator
MPTSPKILVTDDELNTLKTLSANLEDMGYRVDTATKGQEALELIRKRGFNIIIADIKLPDISGLEILETAKELNPETAVIMITGHASLETAVNAINEGAYAYILKPVAMSELETTLNNALREQRLLSENRELVESLQQSNKRMEEANRALEQVSQAKSDFTARMSHELRTPLNSIIGFSEVLLSKKMSPADQATHEEFLGYIHISAEHLLHLIDSILDLSKIEAGKLTLEPREFDFRVLLEDVKITVLPMLTAKKQALNIEIGEGVNSIFADEPKMRQIFLNLLSNAHKFTPRGGRIRVVCQLEKPHLLQCSVIDNGIGISPQDQQKIFEEFGQVKKTPADNTKGVGLGLSIAKRLVELHGGSIWVVSEPGGGSTFTFTIPLTKNGREPDAR